MPHSVTTRSSRPTLASWLFFGAMGATIAAALTCTLVIDGFVRDEARQQATQSLQTKADALRDALDRGLAQHHEGIKGLAQLDQVVRSGDPQAVRRTLELVDQVIWQQHADALVLAADGTVLLGAPELQGRKLDAAPGYLMAESKTRGPGREPGLGWNVVLRQPEAVAMAQYKVLQTRTQLAALALCLLLAPLLWLLARRLAAPLWELTARLDANRAALPARAPGNPLYREAELLGEAMSRYARRQAEDAAHLRELNATLEARVAERTEALAHSEQRLRTITDNLPVLIAYIDKQERFQFCNATYSNWLGIDTARMLGQTVQEALGAELYQARQAPLRNALAGERTVFDMPTTIQGVTRHLHTTYLPDVSPEGGVAGIYALAVDVSAMKAAEEQLIQMARTDTLTGLANRLGFNEKLAHALARSRRHGQPIALLFLDVDKFKGINDTLGHAVGDEVLKVFAQRLLASVRETDTVARLAGDEFVVILEDLHTPAEPQFVARKIIAAINRPFELPSAALEVSTSIGIAFQADGRILPAQMLAVADKALYEAKAGGRNTFRMAAS